MSDPYQKMSGDDLVYVAMNHGDEILRNAGRDDDDLEFLCELLESGEWKKFAPSYFNA